MFVRARRIDSFPYSNVSPPCIYKVYGSMTGASALNSIVLPCVKLPAGSLTPLFTTDLKHSA